jgi:short-subunit dehydrogenase
MRVFLTGASSGIGEALARHYATLGATLGLTGRRADLLSSLAGSLGGTVAVYGVDVRDREAMQRAAEDFISTHGLPDLVIGNAGISHGTLTAHGADAEVFKDILETNVVGLVHTFSPFVDGMRARGSGALVGIASVAGFRGLPGAGAYSASKAAAIAYLESLRVELHGTGVQVTTVCPGYIATPMTEKNPYPMPFMIPADEFARRFTRVVAAKKSFAVIPWQMAIVGRALKLLPNWLYDRLFARAPRKPRKPGSES